MDELDAQLKQYADAAESRVPATPERRPQRRSRRPLLAAAAAVALIGGPLGVFLATRDADERIDTVPAEQLAPSIETCPAHGSAGPEMQSLHVALPFVSTAETSFDRSTSGVENFDVRFRKDTAEEVRIHIVNSLRAAGSGPDQPNTAVEICDPFREQPGPPTIIDARFDDLASGDRPSSAHVRAIGFALGSWWVTIFGREGVDVETLRIVAGGMTWPSTAAPERPDTPTTTKSPGTRPTMADSVAPNSPDGVACPGVEGSAIRVGSHAVTFIPEGFTPLLPVSSIDRDSIAADGGLSGLSRSDLRLEHPDGRFIELSSISAASALNPALNEEHLDDTERIMVRRCNDGDVIPGESVAQLSEGPTGTVVTGEELGRPNGYVVSASAGVGRDDIVKVIEGFAA